MKTGKVFYAPPVRDARFLKRLNRFAAVVETPNREKLNAHVPNSGRLGELLAPNRRVMVTGENSSSRKTDCDLSLAALEGGGWACIDSRLPARILEYSWETACRQTSFEGWEIIKREPAYGKGRFDLLLQKGTENCLVETKSVTLVQNQTALFPDAPTERGRRHMEELLAARREGYRAAVFFIVQREDAEVFAPNDSIHPGFGEALRRSLRGGVSVHCFSCRVDREGITLANSLPLQI